MLWDRSFVLLPCWPSFGLLFACTLSLYLFADFRPFFAVDLGLEQPLNYNTTCNCCIGLQVVGFQDWALQFPSCMMTEVFCHRLRTVKTSLEGTEKTGYCGYFQRNGSTATASQQGRLGAGMVDRFSDWAVYLARCEERKKPHRRGRDIPSTCCQPKQTFCARDGYNMLQIKSGTGNLATSF